MYRRGPDSSIEARTRTVSIFNVIPPNQHLHELRNWLLVYGTTKEAVESLIVQLHSHSKLTRCNNRKIRHKKGILKEKDHKLHV
jgi:hypothetical protein